MADKGIEADFIYSSEKQDLAHYREHLGSETVIIDPDRLFMSISGEQILQDPFPIKTIFQRRSNPSSSAPWR